MSVYGTIRLLEGPRLLMTLSGRSLRLELSREAAAPLNKALFSLSIRVKAPSEALQGTLLKFQF